MAVFALRILRESTIHLIAEKDYFFFFFKAYTISLPFSRYIDFYIDR